MPQKHKDLSGQKFGDLTILKYLRTEKIPCGNQKRTLFIYSMLCICGEVIERDISDIKRGNTRSCGCMTKYYQRASKYIEGGAAAFNGLYASYRRGCAEYRNLTFELTKEEFKKIVTSNCYCCGKEPSQIKKSKISQFIYKGVDRVDNKKGYSIYNCVAACKECNSLKSGITKEILLKAFYFLFLQGTQYE